MEGQHQLGTDITVDSVHNITITANDSQSSSNPIITCSSLVGLWFSNSTSITIASIVINNCSNHGNTSGALAFYNISGALTLDGITVTNSNSRGIVMNKVEAVKIHECILNSNGNGGIEMVDVREVIIVKCSFIQNTAKYGQGEGGGLKIKASSSTCPILSLIYSNFTNNTALYGGGLLIDIQYGNMTVSDSHFSYNTVQRLGGGVTVCVSNGTYHPNVTFIQSTFEHNTVLGEDVLPHEEPAGGGVYIYFTAIKSAMLTIVKVIGCIFNDNNGNAYGGGIAVNIDAVVNNKYPITTVIESSLFHSNRAYSVYSGGAIFTYTNITISYSKFINNTGLCIIYQSNVLSSITIDNSIFSDNLGVGLLSGADVSNLLMINTLFERQQGHAMHVAVHYNFTLVNVSVIACKDVAIIIECSTVLGSRSLTISNLKILNNQGTGLDMTNCMAVCFNGSNIIANNNAAVDGGGMSIRGIGGVRLLLNATLLVRNNTAGRYGGGIYVEEWIYTQRPLSWYPLCSFGIHNDNINVHFEANKAVAAGDNIYGGNFGCEHATLLTRSMVVTGLPYSFPKQSDQVSSRSTKPFSDLELASSANSNFIANRSCKTFVYTPKLSHSTNSSTRNQFNVTLNISNSFIPDGYINIPLTILPCPPGLMLDIDTKSCVCDSIITQKVSGIKCNVSWMPHPIKYSQNNWIGYYNPLNCTIAHSGCPFDYCVSSSATFSLNESDLQCNYNRSGILCGQCKPGLSLMLGSNKCSQCSNDWLALIPVFAISGVLLVVLLIALNLTVSVGSINGMLFYANIVKLNESAFFPRGGIPVISQFIAWLNLDWGIETCLYNGLDSYWKVMLQFVFPMYL